MHDIAYYTIYIVSLGLDSLSISITFKEKRGEWTAAIERNRKREGMSRTSLCHQPLWKETSFSMMTVSDDNGAPNDGTGERRARWSNYLRAQFIMHSGKRALMNVGARRKGKRKRKIPWMGMAKFLSPCWVSISKGFVRSIGPTDGSVQ